MSAAQGRVAQQIADKSNGRIDLARIEAHAAQQAGGDAAAVPAEEGQAGEEREKGSSKKRKRGRPKADSSKKK